MAGVVSASVAATTYEQLAGRYGQQSAAEKVGEWAFSLRRGARLRLAIDNMWFAEKGIEEAGHAHDRLPGKCAAVLCAYDAEKIVWGRTCQEPGNRTTLWCLKIPAPFI